MDECILSTLGEKLVFLKKVKILKQKKNTELMYVIILEFLTKKSEIHTVHLTFV